MFEKELIALKSIVKNSPRSTALVIDILANLQRNKPTNDLRRIREKINEKFKAIVPMEEMEEIYTEFQRVGWGAIQIKRGQGAHSTFTWKFDYRAFCQLVIGEGIVNAKNVTLTKPDVFKVISKQPVDTGGQTFVIKLSSSGTILKLTMSEIMELDEYIQALKR